MTSATDPSAEDFVNMGIDEAMIKKFVNHFYNVVHDDKILAPYFLNQMTVTWDEHLEKMYNFWSAILLKTHRFKGRPMPAHTKLTGLQQSDFLHWLIVFEKTIKACCPPESVPHIMKKAHMIANSLQYGVFYRPELMKEKYDLD